MMRNLFFAFILCLFQLTAAHPVRSVEKIIMWGHKHGHTHHYIHEGFERAFKHLGFETYWFDDRDSIPPQFDFSNALFITEGQVDKKIPIRSDCYYVIHNCNTGKYQHFLDNGHAIILQVYTHDCLQRNEPSLSFCFHYDLKQPVIYMPWATDLLPHEIDEIKMRLPHITKNKTAQFIGTMNGGGFGNQMQISAFSRACNEDSISFNPRNAGSCSSEENIKLVQESFIAPALQGPWQCEKGYIPCRIFKNISYGALGITNSKTVYELFEGKIVYHEDPHQLFYDAKKCLEDWTLEKQYELMDLVRDKHTYLNRIESLFSFFEMVEQYQHKGMVS